MAYKTIIGTMKTAGTLDISSGDIDLAAGSVDNADLAGSIANSKLANSSLTVTAGNGLKTGGAVSLGGSVTVDLDLNELTAAAVDVANDSLAIVDANDSNASKKESIADLMTAVAGDGLKAASGVLAMDLNELTAAAVAVGADSIAIIDADDNSSKKESIAELMTAAAGDGLKAASGVLALDLNELSAAAVAVDADSIAIIDAGDNSSKKESIADLVTAMAGDGLAASSGVLAVGVDGSTVELNSDAVRVKAAGINVSHLNSAVAGAGLSGGAGSALAVDHADFSRVDIAAGDHFLVLDSDGSTEQLERVDKFSDFLAGDGLEASSGVMAVKVADSSVEINSDTVRVTASGVTTAMLAGSIANAKLANSAVSIAGTSVSLGGSITALSAVTDVDAAAGNLTIFDGQQGSGGTLTIGHASGVTKIAGKLQVVGSMDTVSATELLVEDLTIKAANGAADSSAADGAGLKIGGASSTLLWDHSKQFMSFNKDVQLNGLTGKLQKISGDTTLTQASFLVRVDTSGGAVTVTLPSSMPEGKVFVIKDKGAAATNAITIATAGSETIDGAASISIISNHGAANLMFDGDNYLVW